jgi:hypothetical protein
MYLGGACQTEAGAEVVGACANLDGGSSTPLFLANEEGFSSNTEETYYCLLELARILLVDSWKFVQAPSGTKSIARLEDTFLTPQGVVVNLIISPVIAKWKVNHSLTLEKKMLELDCFCVVVVQGDVEEKAFRINVTRHSQIHVMTDLALKNKSTYSPFLVKDNKKLHDHLAIKSSKELKQVKCSAPEVQLLRAEVGDVLAYPPTAGKDYCGPNGQVDDWTARVVVT